MHGTTSMRKRMKDECKAKTKTLNQCLLRSLAGFCVHPLSGICLLCFVCARIVLGERGWVGGEDSDPRCRVRKQVVRWFVLVYFITFFFMEKHAWIVCCFVLACHYRMSLCSCGVYRGLGNPMHADWRS